MILTYEDLKASFEALTPLQAFLLSELFSIKSSPHNIMASRGETATLDDGTVLQRRSMTESLFSKHDAWQVMLDTEGAASETLTAENGTAAETPTDARTGELIGA